MKNIEYRLIKKLQKYDNKKGKIHQISHMIFSPYYFIMEYICRRNIWIKFIMPDMITNDNIMKFLDEQDFTIYKNTFIKKDLVDNSAIDENSNQLYPKKDLKAAKALISKDWQDTFYNLIKENFSLDVENYINIFVDTEVGVAYDESTDKYFREPIYTVICRYWREVHYQEEKRRFIIWSIIFIIVLINLIIFNLI